jgi:hypothetical protein
MHVSQTKQQGLTEHTQPACTTLYTTLTASTYNPPIMASSSSASDWEYGACASSNKGGKYCTMCATPHQKRQAVLAALAANVAVPTAVVSVPAAVAMAIPSAPSPGAIIGMPAAVVAAPATAVSVAASEVQNKMIFMGHQISSCHVPVVRSFFHLVKDVVIIFKSSV